MPTNWTAFHALLGWVVARLLVVLITPNRLFLKLLIHMQRAFFAYHRFKNIGVVAEMETLLAHLGSE